MNTLNACAAGFQIARRMAACAAPAEEPADAS
jgi:hypothetical protein